MNKITAEDLYKLQVLGDVKISPDGERIAYTVTRVNKETEKKHSNIWIAPFKSGKPRQFTHGDNYEGQCKWSPDGKQIAFLSTRASANQSQIYIIPTDGGEARQLTKFRGPITIYSWSPDGKTLLAGGRELTDEEKKLQDDEKAKKLGLVDRHIDKTNYKLDGSGYHSDGVWQIYTINVRTGKMTPLTKANYSSFNASWSADGKRIVFTRVESDDPGADPKADRLCVMRSDGKGKKEIPLNCYYPNNPTFSPDGKTIAFYALSNPYDWADGAHLWLVSSNGKGRAKNITKKFDLHLMTASLDDVQGGPWTSPPIWSPEGDKVYFQSGRHGNETLVSVDVAARGRELKPVFEERGLVHAPSISSDGKRFAFGFSTQSTTSEVFGFEVESGAVKQRSNINSTLLKKKNLGTIEEVWTGGKEGKGIHGWILKPPGFRKNKKYPAILEIHGGPHAQYANSFMHEFQYLAAAGYVVFYSNPRGSQGYGEKHVKAISSAWGSVDYTDVMSWTNYVAKLPYVDSKRLGVTGGSYGGYMTNWIIGKTNKFKAAVTQRSISSFVSMWGMSDFNWHMQHALEEKLPWEDYQKYWRHSPLKYAGNVKTPCLIIHSEFDLRCPQGEGEQWYVALKRVGVDTELVIFPNESHGLSRGGRTDRRIKRLEHIRRWFDKYL